MKNGTMEVTAEEKEEWERSSRIETIRDFRYETRRRDPPWRSVPAAMRQPRRHVLLVAEIEIPAMKNRYSRYLTTLFEKKSRSYSKQYSSVNAMSNTARQSF
ncbi:hypothetical protein PIB30_089748 [Stylosanthes scabra]|uniref:Uncharacterized protein n=1 Tax=Stylosanthes scabra TaxID=79078 RepID=A0ABU6RU04_9FABA|nr:hypothetical protein [Stylosanthes scabra]